MEAALAAGSSRFERLTTHGRAPTRDSMMRMYHVAPAGTPIGLSDLVSCLRDQLTQLDALEAFRTSIRDRYGSRYCLFVSTGRAALALILQTMRELAPSDRDEVIIPSYTCYSVPAAVARAGLKVRICDVDARTLDYDHAALERADFSRVLCVASANLYGIPNDLHRLRAIAGSRGAFVLDDAAQSMEARVNGEFSGTLGDVGIFSLDKGKNITTIDGGIIVTDREDLGTLLLAKVAALPQPSAATRLVYFAKLMVYSIFLHPRLYWMPDSARFLKLGTTMYPRDLAIEAYPAFLAGVGDRLFRRIEELTSARIENARYLLGKLHDLEAVQLVSIPPQASPVFLRLPVFVRGNERDRAVAMLHQAGIGASGSFPTCIADIPGIDPGLFRGASDSEAGRWVAQHILTLPTHPFADTRSLDRAVSALKASTAG